MYFCYFSHIQASPTLTEERPMERKGKQEMLDTASPMHSPLLRQLWVGSRAEDCLRAVPVPVSVSKKPQVNKVHESS